MALKLSWGTKKTEPAAAPEADKNADAGAGTLIDVSRFPAEKAVEHLIQQAVKIGASDLFFCAQDQHYDIEVRHLGIIRPLSVVTTDEGKRMIAYLRNNSGADVQERRKPVDGRWIYNGMEGEVVDLRINFIPTMHGEDVAMRLLVRGHELFNIEQLGMSPEQLSQYTQMLESVSGLVLITGPTGAGKSGTLYSSLLKLNDGRRKINTIEDPIEYAVDGIHQSSINPAIDLGFAELLRAVLRQSPDVIMIGEIRDEETARIAVRAANSGTLVIGTLHAPDTATAVQSMRGYGVAPHFLATSLRGVVSQRLVRTLDPTTRIEFDLADAPEAFVEVKEFLAEGEGKRLYAPGPAEKNQMTGYSGRTGVFEVMTVNKTIRALIASGASADDIRTQARKDGMLPFKLAALLKVARGITSTEELFRVIPTEQLTMEF
jgi:type II secretory ATPase GspE/PulE/Tfp pilus assembly ATPase PilB-like protein